MLPLTPPCPARRPEFSRLLLFFCAAHAMGTALYAAAHLPWILGIPFALLSAIGLTLTIARHHRGPRPPPGKAEDPPPESTATSAPRIRIVTLR